MDNEYDLADIWEVIEFEADEEKAFEMIKNANFDLSELDEEGRNIVDMAEVENMTEVLKFLNNKGLKNTWEGTEFDLSLRKNEDD